MLVLLASSCLFHAGDLHSGEVGQHSASSVQRVAICLHTRHMLFLCESRLPDAWHASSPIPQYCVRLWILACVVACIDVIMGTSGHAVASEGL